MQEFEIEIWALSIIDRFKSKQPIEDSIVELKAVFHEDSNKMARRIGGHANAARGERILWLIGINEKAGTIPGVTDIDFAKWYAGIASQFDGLAPEPKEVNVPVDGVTVVAICFETHRAPFVVKNPKNDPIDREVPWREGTAVMSAKREHLIRLLVPIQKKPEIEVVACWFDLSTWKSKDGKEYLKYELSLALFLTQPPEQVTVIPSHRCKAAFTVPNYNSFNLWPNFHFFGVGSANISAAKDSVTIKGVGLFEARTQSSFSMDGAEKFLENEVLFASGINISVRLFCVGVDKPIHLAFTLEKTARENVKGKRWWSGRYKFDKLSY